MRATSQYSTPRRQALALGGIAALGAIMGAAPATAREQDSALLILCSEFHRTQAELDQWHKTGFELEPIDKEGEAYRLWDAENNRVLFANNDVFTEIMDMPAKTQAGIVAKSKVLAVHMDRVVVNLDGSMTGASTCEVFAFRLVQNTVQVAGGVA